MSLEAAIEPSEIVTALTGYVTQADIARGAGVSDRTVRSWVNDKTSVRQSNYQNLFQLREVVLILRDSLSARGVRQWMLAPNRLLGERVPLQVLHEGDFAEVKRAARAFAEGVYL